MHLPNWASSHLEFKRISPTDLLSFFFFIAKIKNFAFFGNFTIDQYVVYLDFAKNIVANLESAKRSFILEDKFDFF